MLWGNYPQIRYQGLISVIFITNPINEIFSRFLYKNYPDSVYEFPMQFCNFIKPPQNILTFIFHEKKFSKRRVVTT